MAYHDIKDLNDFSTNRFFDLHEQISKKNKNIMLFNKKKMITNKNKSNKSLIIRIFISNLTKKMILIISRAKIKTRY